MQSRVVSRWSALAMVVFFAPIAAAQQPQNAPIDTDGESSVLRDLKLHEYQTATELTKLVQEQLVRIAAAGDVERHRRIEQMFAEALQPLSESYAPPATQRLELHAVGIYRGDPFRPNQTLAKVRITHRSAPIILCLSAYEGTHWKIAVDEGVQLKQVILTGYEAQSVEGIPEQTSLADYSRRGIPYCYRRSASDGDSDNYPAFCAALLELTGLDVNTFTEQYSPQKGQSILVGPANASWREQRAFGGLERVYDAAVADLRRRVWDEIKGLRFTALYRRPANPNAGQAPRGGEEVAAADYTVLGPLAAGMVALNDAAATAIDPRGARPGIERLQLTELRSGVSTLLPTGADSGAPRFNQIIGAAFDATRKRWTLVVQAQDGAWMYAYDVAEQDWLPLRQMQRIDLHVLAYDKHSDSLFGLASQGFGHRTDEMTLYRMHPDGAIVARDEIPGLHGQRHPGHGPWIQLIPLEKHVVAIVSERGDLGAPNRDQERVFMNVIDRATHRVVFTALQSDPDTFEGQLAQLEKRFAGADRPKFVPALAPAPPGSDTANVEIEETEAVAPVRNPQNGHWYEVVEHDELTWKLAKELAESRTYRGLRGYLATVTSEEESNFLGLNFEAGDCWLGGSDEETEGVWKWVGGPEAGQVFWRGAGTGEAVGYANWGRSRNSPEPNNSSEEDFLVMLGTSPFGRENSDAAQGLWNDMGADRTANRVIIEFSLPDEKPVTED